MQALIDWLISYLPFLLLRKVEHGKYMFHLIVQTWNVSSIFVSFDKLFRFYRNYYLSFYSLKNFIQQINNVDRFCTQAVFT